MGPHDPFDLELKAFNDVDIDLVGLDAASLYIAVWRACNAVVFVISRGISLDSASKLGRY